MMMKPRTLTILLLVLAVAAVWLVSCSRDSSETTPTYTESVGVTETSVTAETPTAMTDVTQTVQEDEEIPVYLNPDGKEFAALFGSFFHVDSFEAAYDWDTGESVITFSVEHTANEPYVGTTMLSINGGEPFDISCVSLQDIRVTREFIAVEPGYTDIGGPLWVFDYDGNLILAVHDVTVEGAEFRGLRAADDDGITVFASRIRHMELMGNAALELQVPYAAYQGLLWDDPVSDFLPGMDAVLTDAFSVDLSRGWDAVPDVLNPELVVSGEYRIPYLGEGQFGQVVPTEHMETLQTFMETQFGERTPAVTQETMTEPDTETTDITLPADTGLAATVDHYLDLLMPDVASYSGVQSVRDKHPEVFDALVALGEDAVPLLQERGQGMTAHDGSEENFRRMLAHTMVQAISPQLYQTDYPSPDGRYAVRAEVYSNFSVWDPFQGIVYTFSLVDLTNGKTAAILDGNYPMGNVTYALGEVIRWSEDSRFAVMENGYRHEYTHVYLFDTVHGNAFRLPGEEELEAIAGGNLFYADTEMYADQIHCHFAAWDGDLVKIDVNLVSVVGGGAEIGYYLYDMMSGQITEFRYDGARTEASSLAAEVSGYLDTLTEGTDGMYSEEEIIAAHPDAFAALTALGTDALPYLAEHADSYYQIGYHSLRGIIAMMAIHAIDPIAYDYSVLSPDGTLCITAELQTLFGIDWGGIRVDVYHNLNVRDVHSGEVLWENMIGDGITNPQLSWSPDGRYAVLTHGSATHFSDTTVFCVTDKTACEFPDIGQILSLAELGDDIPSYSIRAAAWREDGRLDGEFSFHFGMTAYYEGSFIFDPVSGEISEFVCTKI